MTVATAIVQDHDFDHVGQRPMLLFGRISQRVLEGWIEPQRERCRFVAGHHGDPHMLQK